MIEFTVRKGGSEEWIDLECQLEGNSIFIAKAFLHIFGSTQRIAINDELMLKNMGNYCMAEYERKQKYKRMEELMLKNLSESVVIENERVYEQCLWEYKQKLEGDERMNDLNGDLNAF